MFSHQHYDQHGGLKLPAMFWAVVILQARSWVLLVMAGASRDQGSALLALFYPEQNQFYAGLIAGLPAVVTFLLSGRRQRYPGLWQRWYWVLIVAQLALLVWQGNAWLTAPDSAGACLTVWDAVALIWLLTHKRLRAAFRASPEA